MKRTWLGTMAATAACIGMVLPTSAMTAPPDMANHDVALREGGLLVGQVVNPQGAVKAHAVVSIRYANHEVVRTTTDEKGVFAAKGLRGGHYELVTDDGLRACRLWAPDTAPPAARPSVLLVSGDSIIRGQGMGSGWVNWMKTHPYLTAGAVAAAVAVPLAIVDDDDSGS